MNATTKLPLLNNYSGKLIASLVFFGCIWGQGIQPSWAEGSKELVTNGGHRPYLEWASSTAAGIPRQTLLKVVVNAGETVNLGSSVHTSSNGIEDIVYRSPAGSQNGSCNVLSTGYGLIDTLAKESAGPLPNTGGYTPCSFIASESGIYEVEFRAPSLSGDPPAVTTTAAFIIDNNQRATVAAWDITVRDTNSGNSQTGRVFANYIALNMGRNGVGLNSRLYIQTKDGYRYETNMNGIDPFAFIFFANSRGFIDKTNNTTLYHSAAGATNNDLNFAGNVNVQNPTLADTATDITHYIFFNRPADVTLATLGVPIIPISPPKPENFLFTGGNGGSGNQTFVGVGGNFSFDVTTSGYYQIIIDTNIDGIFDPSVDRVLQNVMSAGQTVVSWDGKNASGVALAARPLNQPYNAQITTRSGEYHFPLLDAENNSSGLIIKMENPPSAFPNILDQNGQNISASTIYYNDDNYTTANGTNIDLNGTGASNPRNAARGIDSSNPLYRHSFTNNYGDFKGIDTWTFFPSQAVFTDLVITTSQKANVQGTKSVRFLEDIDTSSTVTVGDTVEYTIIYSNLSPGNSDAINFVITDDLPSQLTFQNAIISSATSGNNITLNNTYNGSGVLTNSGTLRVGDTITIKITAKINNDNGGNPIINQGSAKFNTPDNPLAAVGTVLTDADSATATTNPPTVSNYFLQTVDDGINTGNNPASTADDDLTLFTVSTVSLPPKLVLVKRITRINNQVLTDLIDGSSADPNATNYVPAPNDADDDDSKWPNSYLQGLINAGSVQPGDELEYTIYFLSNGLAAAKNVKFCDLVPNNVTFIPNAFNGLTPNDGASSTIQGIALAVGSSTPTAYLSNAIDTDRGSFYPANDATTPTSCGSNTNGAVVVDITNSTTLLNLPPATGSGTPVNSYGFVRFRGQVK
ncbi:MULTISPECIES: isopeptide-forming domain-containing fimbrial protein [unclassified Anabaena]|uniref:isopeptide-forming domain-containing fimbrial protein n=1 Tax=unclassified Anabaena TaxID=2619674 RepID=UPI001445190E|nr:MULTISPECIES: isopeptide-forming domain-containing fimbrial protein [unclassified Anabaena]MTJ09226.1 DUF11 domain-containing protein [Anabaena sp. UHCC 0204]MTJ54012.1 DUF11 domain-containing protein [Anabaena sp. UHCC 0253]